jgi:CPA2 family monovalent cation:H+ antiporter-2
MAIDSDAANAAKGRKDGFPVYYGDASNVEFLRVCGIGTAKVIAVTMDNADRVDDVVTTVRAQWKEIKIIARARDERHAKRLYEEGVSDAVPETIEASLQLGESILVEAGIAMGLAIAAVHERRDGYRKLLGRPNRKQELASLRRRMRQGIPKPEGDA